ncbi:anti sigma factor C-terminal domain-containing protein [Cytobacillus praedii]|uniref:anti-sigma factor n=1 Tax=Cytobacillus praedii TaxID=1742358 RepID=UPI003F80D9C1
MKENNQEDKEIYQSYINHSIQDFENNQTNNVENQKFIVKKGKYMALITTIMISLAILLLIIPVMTLSSYLYYAIGGKANHLIDIATKTVYVTEPNISLEEMELEEHIKFFSMDIQFDIFKRIGKEDYKAGEYFINYAFDKPAFPEREILLDRPLPKISSMESHRLFHPDAAKPPGLEVEWDLLKKLPDGTVGEVYISLTKLMKAEELEKQLGKNVEVRWVAVDTGLEKKELDKDGYPVAPIGYPLQIDHTTWSPFNGRDQTNEEVFMDILEFLRKDEENAAKIASAKTLALEERVPYLKKNGIHVYGAVVTGPIPELRKLQENEAIRTMKVGEVKLWNWK